MNSTPKVHQSMADMNVCTRRRYYRSTNRNDYDGRRTINRKRILSYTDIVEYERIPWKRVRVQYTSIITRMILIGRSQELFFYL